MKLYVTSSSPYARMARMAVLEKGLERRVEIIEARTRTADSPYYRINPSGRVPYLVRDDGVGMEESELICAWLGQLDGKPMFQIPAPDAWEERRLYGFARSMIDGVSVWNRELARPENERSPTVIRHEQARSARMADVWEKEIASPLVRAQFNLLQLTLLCCLGLEARNAGFRWRDGRPKLAAWFDALAKRPSFVATLPPEAAR
jgi:glutathione S-transferase